MKKIFIFGMGSVYSTIKLMLNLEKLDIQGFITSELAKKNHIFEGKPVVWLEHIHQHEYDYILIAATPYESIKEQLLSAGVPNEKIIGFHVNGSKFWESSAQQVNETIEQQTNRSIMDAMLQSNLEKVYLCNMPKLGRKRNLEIGFIDDYVRLSTLELVAQKIIESNVQGNVAELGVYQGAFAAYINKLFPAKKLYLFDTFEGFAEADVNFEMKQNNVDNKHVKRNYLNNTSIELVLSKMSSPENCIIKKGYFPASAEDLEDEFAFVSIDADLFQPIYEGLKYFYPRLVRGGFIFVHDYNNAIYQGAKRAVDLFCDEMKIACVPMSDNCGSAVIVK